MRTRIPVRNRRRILFVFPRYSPAFGTFTHAYRLIGRVRAFMPPQGPLVLAAYLPECFEVRFVDENIRPASREDFDWAEAVLVSGMHIQAAQIHDITRRAHTADRIVVLGGPSVSARPDSYPDVDVLHVGEIGDATDDLVTLLDRSVERPTRQIVLRTQERLALADFPLPAYELIELGAYFIGSVQFSSGCPYRCEFCDLPALYGRQPRLKTPPQVIAELDAMLARDHPPAIYFVDDNFVGNRKAARELLEHLVAWQKRNGYPVLFACEATLNIAKQHDLLALMREARFDTVFVGIESPDLGALKAMDKGHNAALPILDAIRTLNGFGMEVVSGIILGLDTDTAETSQALLDFVARSQIPMLTINLLQALPRTPLWERLERTGRLIEDPLRDSNVDFLRPYDAVMADWRRVIRQVYEPTELLARFRHQVDHTYGNRVPRPLRSQLTGRNIWVGLRLFANLTLRIGMSSDFARAYWALFRHCLKVGQLESALAVGLVAYHLVTFAQEAAEGRQSASFYAEKARAAE